MSALPHAHTDTSTKINWNNVYRCSNKTCDRVLFGRDTYKMGDARYCKICHKPVNKIEGTPLAKDFKAIYNAYMR